MPCMLSKGCFLSQLAPLDKNTECSICYEEVTMPYTTKCRHTFCRECLGTWTATHPTCPTCRCILYLDPEDEDALLAYYDRNAFAAASGSEHDSDDDSTDSEDDDPTDDATARRLAADTGFITTRFTIDHDKVIGHLVDLYKRNERHIDYDPGERNDLVKIDYSSQINACIASLLYIKPHRGDAHSLADVCHQDWETVAQGFRNVLLRHDGELMEARELWWVLVDEVAEDEFLYDYPKYSSRVEVAHAANGGCSFEEDFYEVATAVVKNARDAFAESAEGDEFEVQMWMQGFEGWDVYW